MKLTILLPLAMARWSAAWDLMQLLLGNFETASSIPTFILDLKHPWIEQHRDWLERYPGVGSALCSSPPNSTLGDEISPEDLFRHLLINNNVVDPEQERYGWANAVSRLREMRNCTVALASAESLLVEVFRYNGRPWKQWWERDMIEPPNPPAELMPLAVDVLDAMPRLGKIEWQVPVSAAADFEAAIAAQNPTLPSIRHLSLSGRFESLVPRCPNLTSFTTMVGYSRSWDDRSSVSNNQSPQQALVAAVASADLPQLRTLTMYAGFSGWSTGLLESR
jgi:hypothetical protein